MVQICGNNRHFSVCVAICYRPTLIAWLLYFVGRAIWSILREAASCGPSALADIAYLFTDSIAGVP